MLVYSRNTLLSLRNCWKASSSAGSYGSVIRPIPEKTWQTLSLYNLLAPRRGQRGGNHLRGGRSITRICDTAAREFRRPKITSSGANYCNLLNIQIVTSKENTTAATQLSTSKFLKLKLQIAHLNVRSVKERNHLILLRELMRENNYDVLAISESWLNSTTTNAEGRDSRI